MTYIIFRGTPEECSDLTEAEERAAELCEENRAPYTILAVDDTYVTYGLVARYRGVVMTALDEDPS